MKKRKLQREVGRGRSNICCPIKVALIYTAYALAAAAVVIIIIITIITIIIISVRDRSREAPLDPHGRSPMPALPGDVMGMKEMLHPHCWVLEPDAYPNPALSHEFGCGK